MIVNIFAGNHRRHNKCLVVADPITKCERETPMLALNLEHSTGRFVCNGL